MPELLANQAAWWQGPPDKHFTVRPGPDYTHPADDEVVIKVAYVAINPSEWKMLDSPYAPVKFPHVLGSDVAGEVVLTGSKVTRFAAGDRVIGHCLGLAYGGATHGAFQLFTTIRETVVAKLAASISYAQGCVMPLATSTAIVGLFEQLRLRQPTLTPKRSGEVILIWGGSTSCGSMAIQLACAAGYEVLTTASPRNYQYAKDLGAAEVFDHSDPEVVDKIKARLNGVSFVGAFDCWGEESTIGACADIVSGLGGGVLPTVVWPPANSPSNVKVVLVIATNPGTLREDTIEMFMGANKPDRLGDEYVAAGVWKDFIPEALSSGLLVPKPDPKVITGGLDKILEGVELQKKGVSAQKIVVEIDSSMK